MNLFAGIADQALWAKLRWAYTDKKQQVSRWANTNQVQPASPYRALTPAVAARLTARPAVSAAAPTGKCRFARGGALVPRAERDPCSAQAVPAGGCAGKIRISDRAPSQRRQNSALPRPPPLATPSRLVAGDGQAPLGGGLQGCVRRRRLRCDAAKPPEKCWRESRVGEAVQVPAGPLLPGVHHRLLVGIECSARAAPRGPES